MFDFFISLILNVIIFFRLKKNKIILFVFSEDFRNASELENSLLVGVSDESTSPRYSKPLLSPYVLIRYYYPLMRLQ